MRPWINGDPVSFKARTGCGSDIVTIELTDSDGAVSPYGPVPRISQQHSPDSEHAVVPCQRPPSFLYIVLIARSRSTELEKRAGYGQGRGIPIADFLQFRKRRCECPWTAITPVQEVLRGRVTRLASAWALRGASPTYRRPSSESTIVIYFRCVVNEGDRALGVLCFFSILFFLSEKNNKFLHPQLDQCLTSRCLIEK